MRFALAALALVAGIVGTPAVGQPYPSKPIRLILAFPPGGTVDAIARPLAERLSAALGQSVVVENRPGGQTVIAGDVVAKAAPDGYTLYIMSASHVLAPYLVKKVPYDAVNDFTAITIFGAQGYVFVGNSREPFATMKEMIAYGRANPGKLSIGVSDSTTQAVLEALHLQAGIDITVINYKGGGPILTDLLGAQLPVGVVSPPVFVPYTKDARLRGLAVTLPSRMPLLPDVPAVDEALPRPGYDVQTWYGIAAPAKLPKPILDRLHAEIMKVLADPEMRKVIASVGLVPPADPGPEASQARLKSYQAQMGKLLESAGVKPE